MIVDPTDLKERIGDRELTRLTDDTKAGSVNADVLAKVIEEGEGELLANIAQRYSLPLSLRDTYVAAAVKAYCMDCIVYRLYLRRERNVTEELSDAHKRAVEWSEKIAQGKLGIPGETERSESLATDARIVVESTERVISRESVRGL